MSILEGRKYFYCCNFQETIDFIFQCDNFVTQLVFSPFVLNNTSFKLRLAKLQKKVAYFVNQSLVKKFGFQYQTLDTYQKVYLHLLLLWGFYSWICIRKMFMQLTRNSANLQISKNKYLIYSINANSNNRDPFISD